MYEISDELLGIRIGHVRTLLGLLYIAETNPNYFSNYLINTITHLLKKRNILNDSCLYQHCTEFFLVKAGTRSH